jgi:N-acyl-D-amino-acid deacylase
VTIRSAIAWLSLVPWSVAHPAPPVAKADAVPRYDVLISGGTVYDGSGGTPFVGDVAIKGDRLAYVGPHAPESARERIDAHGKAVARGFINMLAHPEESLRADGLRVGQLAGDTERADLDACRQQRISRCRNLVSTLQNRLVPAERDVRLPDS